MTGGAGQAPPDTLGTMSDTAGSHAADTPRDVPVPGAGGASPDVEQQSWTQAEQTQPSPEQPYDVPSSAQQYGQPPSTGYQPPDTDQPGQWAPVQGNGPQQYGQPEHGQASYAQEGFPAPGTGPGGYQPATPGYGQPPVTGAPGYGDPAQGFSPQAPPYEQQPYGSPLPYPGQPYAPQGQPPYPSQGQQPYPGQPYAGQQPYPGQAPYAPQGQPPFPGQGYPPQPYGAQPPAPLSDNDQRLWATLTHISIPFFGFVGPLVAYLVLKDRSPFLKDSTTEGLNFSILYSIVYVIGIVLTGVVVGAIVLLVAGIGALVLCILAAIKTNKGELYRYPLNWRLVK